MHQAHACQGDQHEAPQICAVSAGDGAACLSQMTLLSGAGHTAPLKGPA